ncbi:hypothetical protein DPEC_G00173690 [Dallia pectoralis]|uniref:Uncharacterized protein n=1 Tax=Dallia pectoralis TaxID=75939 RepID=A0ACC2GEB7_DALPE|nr:hypothetical protein DPEC_G00173690 [Dallia pectoralis]
MSSVSVGHQGGPRPPAAPPTIPELPDLSHLTEEERKIIMAVMDRQKEEEEKEEAMLKEPQGESAHTPQYTLYYKHCTILSFTGFLGELESTGCFQRVGIASASNQGGGDFSMGSR